jgi:hypothetical protein
MAHYAYLNNDNIVIQTFVGKHEGEDGINWEEWYGNHEGLTCKRYSINMLAGNHKSGKDPFRKNNAGVGYIYDPELDAFYEPQPHPSWQLNTETCVWEPPTPRPSIEYVWDEPIVGWSPRVRGES